MKGCTSEFPGATGGWALPLPGSLLPGSQAQLPVLGAFLSSSGQMEISEAPDVTHSGSYPPASWQYPHPSVRGRGPVDLAGRRGGDPAQPILPLTQLSWAAPGPEQRWRDLSQPWRGLDLSG